MKSNKLSVVVPIYNMKKYLKKSLDSIISQTYKNLEILLIDDGSTDGSLDICKEYSNRDDRIRVFHKKNGGLSDAKNYGIKKSTGEFITFVDPDDWIDREMYKIMMESIATKNADIAICGRFLDYDDGRSEKFLNSQNLEMDSKESLVVLNTFRNIDMASWDKIYKTKLFNGVEFPYKKKCEDAYTTYKLFAKAKKIINIPLCFYHYYQRPGSISRDAKINMDYVYAAGEQLQFIKNEYPDLTTVAETNYLFAAKSLYQTSIERGMKINDELKRLRKDNKKYAKALIKNDKISAKKKMTGITYLYFPCLYRVLIRLKTAVKGKI